MKTERNKTLCSEYQAVLLAISVIFLPEKPAQPKLLDSRAKNVCCTLCFPSFRTYVILKPSRNFILPHFPLFTLYFYYTVNAKRSQVFE